MMSDYSVTAEASESRSLSEGVTMHATITVGTRARTYTVAGDPDGPQGRALVLVFHGSRQDGATHRQFTGRVLDTLAHDNRAVIAYLDGHRGNWNDARAESAFPARRDQIDDVAFARALVDELQRTHHIDRSRVIGLGFSNGGQMIFRLLHEAPDLLAGSVIVSATMPARESFLSGYAETAERSVPITLIHGTTDPIIPYQGGRMPWWARKVFTVDGVSLSAPATAEYFASRNGISAEPEVTALPHREASRRPTRVERTRYSAPDKAPVTLYTVINGGHTVPSPKAGPAIVGRTATDISIDEIVSDVIDLT